MSQFRPCNFGNDSVHLEIAVIELEKKKNDDNGG